MNDLLNFICIPDIVFDRIACVNGKRVHRIFYVILKNGCITKTKLIEECGYDKNGMNKAILTLINIGLINKFMNKDGIIVYFISGLILSKIKLICGECKYGKIRTKKIDDCSVRYINCKRIKPESCIKNRFREYYNAYKIISLSFRNITEVENLKREKIEEENILEQNSDEWNATKFNKFVIALYYEFFDDVIVTGNFRKILHNKMRSLCKIFFDIIGKNWRRALRCYLYSELLEAKNKSRGINWDYVIDLNHIKKIIEKINIDFKRINRCKIKNINCKYMQKDGCSLIKDGIGCSQNIINYMKRRYS